MLLPYSDHYTSFYQADYLSNLIDAYVENIKSRKIIAWSEETLFLQRMEEIVLRFKDTQIHQIKDKCVQHFWYKKCETLACAISNLSLPPLQIKKKSSILSNIFLLNSYKLGLMPQSNYEVLTHLPEIRNHIADKLGIEDFYQLEHSFKRIKALSINSEFYKNAISWVERNNIPLVYCQNFNNIPFVHKKNRDLPTYLKALFLNAEDWIEIAQKVQFLNLKKIAIGSDPSGELFSEEQLGNMIESYQNISHLSVDNHEINLIPNLALLKELQYVKFSNCSSLHYEKLVLTHIKTFKLDQSRGNKIDLPLEKMNLLALQKLKLINCIITDVGCETLLTLESLKSVILTNVSVSEKGYVFLNQIKNSHMTFEITENLSSLSKIAIASAESLVNLTIGPWTQETNFLSEDVCAAIGKSKTLELLDMTDDDSRPNDFVFSDENAQAISQCSTLRTLILEKDLFSSNGLACISKMKNLERLHIFSLNNENTYGLTQFQNDSQLQEFIVSNLPDGFSDSVCQFLGSFPKLKFFNCFPDDDDLHQSEARSILTYMPHIKVQFYGSECPLDELNKIANFQDSSSLNFPASFNDNPSPSHYDNYSAPFSLQPPMEAQSFLDMISSSNYQNSLGSYWKKIEPSSPGDVEMLPLGINSLYSLLNSNVGAEINDTDMNDIMNVADIDKKRKKATSDIFFPNKKKKG